MEFDPLVVRGGDCSQLVLYAHYRHHRFACGFVPRGMAQAQRQGLRNGSHQGVDDRLGLGCRGTDGHRHGHDRILGSVGLDNCVV